MKVVWSFENSLEAVRDMRTTIDFSTQNINNNNFKYLCMKYYKKNLQVQWNQVKWTENSE